jgi:hypothetical protein
MLVFEQTFIKKINDDVRWGEITERYQEINDLKPYAKTGEKVKKGAKSGHIEVHGTDEEKATRWREYQEHINALSYRNPHLSYSDLQKEAAKHCKVSAKTIQRHTTNPKESKQS